MSRKTAEKDPQEDATRKQGRGTGQGRPQAGGEDSRGGEPAPQRPPASSPCLLDEDDPQIDPDYLGRR